MHLSENEGIEGKRFVVTGGVGFVGSALCLELIRRGATHVRAFDLVSNSSLSRRLVQIGVNCIQGDITQKKDVDRALRGADCVFHLASFGMSGKEMLQYGHIDEVNINGTCHVLDACIEHGIKRLVYVSTYNVVFGGKEIVNGNETLPYFPMDDHADPYGRSKAIAEQLVLKSNGRPFKEKNGKCLYTCAIRPAAIYGPGEQRHLPRIVNLAKLGLLPFKIGEANVKSDWVYVDNLVLALIMASMGLLDDIPGRGSHPVAAGQPYFISDGSPVNTFVFLRPLLQSLEYDMPKASLAVPHALMLGKLFWALYTIMYPWLNKWWLPEPLMLPTEVHKNWYCYGKAVAEQAAWEEAKQRGVDMVALNPVLVLGPVLQPTINASIVHILKYLTGSAKTYANSVQAYVHVKDVAAAHILLFENPSATGRYLCAESSLHRGDVVEILAKYFPEYPIPTKCSDQVKPRAKPLKFSNQKLKDLGFEFTPVKQCLYETVKSLQEKGHLPVPTQQQQDANVQSLHIQS